MAVKEKEKFTLKNRVVFDPINRKFIQKDHLVHGAKVLQYPEATCEYCSIKYPKHRKQQRFCSTPCRMKWWLRQQHDGQDPDYGMTNCAICGNSFQKTRPWSKYCSDDCQTEGRRLMLREARELAPVSSFKDTVRICNQCGEEYVPRMGNQKFCSKECSRDFRLEKYGKPRICEYCSKSYKTTVISQRYCSRSCASKAQKAEEVITEIGQIKKEKERKRYCRICGHRAYSEHHITPRDEGGSGGKRNKARLCKRCHDIVEEIYENEGIKYSPDLVDRIRRMLGPDKVKRNYYEKTTTKAFVG